jgi:hypothetical protein
VFDFTLSNAANIGARKKKKKYMKILLCRLQGDILNNIALLEEPPGYARFVLIKVVFRRR